MAITREMHSRESGWRPEVVDESNISTALKANQAVYYVLSILEGLLLLRFAFKLFAANVGNNFVEFVYRLSSPFIAPFQGIFGTPAENGSVFESATILAMVAYAMLAYVVARLFFVSSEGTERLENRSSNIIR